MKRARLGFAALIEGSMQMKVKIPLLLFPPKTARFLSHNFYGVANRLLKPFAFVEKELYKLDADMTATEYLSGSLLNAVVYFLLVEVLAYAVLVKTGVVQVPILYALGAALFAGAGVFLFCMAYPRFMNNKKIAQMDRDLLFAVRHLRIQTTAGVPLFDAIVSASHGYGAVSEEFKKIVTEVEAGTNLADAFEDSAVRNPSYYYSRILWQMSNAVKAGTDIGPVISDIVEFLSEEQRIEVRNYGAQLNTLAIMYLMVCIIVPTISLIFLMVISSFVETPITDVVFVFILAGLIFVQYMFIGIIESRRPAVSI